MKLGPLKHRIEILEDAGDKNGYGEQIPNWIAVTSCLASMDPILGKEYFAAETVQSNVDVKFRLRWRAGVTDLMRVRHRDVDYNIESVVNVKQQSREMLLYCSKVVDQTT